MVTLIPRDALSDPGNDLLLRTSTARDSARARSRGAGRPPELQQTLQAFGNLILADTVPMMAKFIGGKIVHLLDRTGSIVVGAPPALDHPLLRAIETILREARGGSSAYQTLNNNLLALLTNLEWYQGRPGAFASRNFQDSHLHALLLGPDGLEHRADVQIGLTVLGPYTRFPDHRQRSSRVYLPLSPGEFRLGEDGWLKAGPGEVLFNEAGGEFAMRCTSRSLLTLWCSAEDIRH